MIDLKTIGLNVQRARRSMGLTQEQLAKKAKVAYSTLAKIERGAIKNPSINTLKSLADSLNSSVDDLISGQVASSKSKTVQSSKIKFVYSDINGVLVRFFQKGFVQVAEAAGVNPEIVETTFWHYNDAINRGEMSLIDFNRILASQIGIKEVDWQAVYMKSVEPINSMHECLKEISKEVPVGLLSNISPGFIDEMLGNGLLPKIDYRTIADSSALGTVKPESRIYQQAQKMAGVSGENIMFIDDSRANLMAAERHGWHVLWFDDYRPEESVKRLKIALSGQDVAHPLDHSVSV